MQADRGFPGQLLVPGHRAFPEAVLGQRALHEVPKSPAHHPSYRSPAGCRLIGDSQASYWYLAMECFLKPFLASEQRQQPTESMEANMWLIKYVEELPHRGAKRAEPRPAACTLYQVRLLPLTPCSMYGEAALVEGAH